MDKDSVIYIAGPMSGKEDFNFPLFRRVQRELEELYPGVPILNPVNHYPGTTDHARAHYMRASVHDVLQATHLVLLPGWSQSRGARTEVVVALELGLMISTWVPGMGLMATPHHTLFELAWKRRLPALEP